MSASDLSNAYASAVNARGYQRANSDLRRIVIGFDDETFAAVKKLATKQRRPFSHVIRELVEWGLMEAQA